MYQYLDSRAYEQSILLVSGTHDFNGGLIVQKPAAIANVQSSKGVCVIVLWHARRFMNTHTVERGSIAFRLVETTISWKSKDSSTESDRETC